MHTTHSNTQYKNESKHSEMGPVRQNPIQDAGLGSDKSSENTFQRSFTMLSAMLPPDTSQMTCTVLH